MKNPKKLNLYEMWDLYLLVGDGTGENLLIDEISSLLEKLSSSKLMLIIQMLFKDVKETNPLKVVLMLIQGMKKNNYFQFSDFIKGLSDGNS